MRAHIILWIAAAAAVLPFGCAKHTTPLAPPREMTAAERNFEAVWQGSRDVLRKYYFSLDRQDRRAGIITTEPMVGKHWCEFWRHDSVSRTDVAESTIQSIYRVVEVRIEPAAGAAGTYAPNVTVHAYRAEREVPQITSTSEAYDLFLMPGGHDRSADAFLLEQGRPQAPAEAGGEEAAGLPAWLVPLGDYGRDRNLEQQLTAEIKAAAVQLHAR